jgi:hypothetical protein
MIDIAGAEARIDENQTAVGFDEQAVANQMPERRVACAVEQAPSDRATAPAIQVMDSHVHKPDLPAVRAPTGLNRLRVCSASAASPLLLPIHQTVRLPSAPQANARTNRPVLLPRGPRCRERPSPALRWWPDGSPDPLLISNNRASRGQMSCTGTFPIHFEQYRFNSSVTGRFRIRRG